ncbi:DUF7504 family protein [Halobacterium yunchengense]|uniref:DUF7504 family protein n=1 Tax=Halobacterium yunchengense TaxID=3108497 RepID=UPI00300B83F8
MPERVRTTDERGDPGGVTLVLAPGVSEGEPAACADLLSGADAALAVSLRHPPDRWLAARESTPPTWFVTTSPHQDSVRTVADPRDLTGVGIAVSEFLEGLPDDAEPAVCVDSLTTLLQYSDPPRVYRFLQVLCGRVRAADGAVHCHADPAAHDDAVLDSLLGLFDDAVAVD